MNHDFFVKTLKYFNFGEFLIKWIALFNKNASCCVSNNGYFSLFFPLQKGVRQGCPLSPYLFIMWIKLLSFTVRNIADIKGVYVGDCEVKETVFANDATFITDGTRKSLETLVDVFDDLSLISGLKLNEKNAMS